MTFAEFFVEIQPALFSIATAILTFIAGYLGKKAKEFLDTKEKRAIVESTVMFVEQVGKALGSEEKFALAKEKALALAEEKGVKIGETELEILIEAFVQKFFYHYHDDLAIPRSEPLPSGGEVPFGSVSEVK